MTTQTHQLVYCSRLRSPMENRQAEIEAIVAIARKQNARSEITGGLFVTGHYAAQMLEGPIDAVERTYARIFADPRHEDVTLLRRHSAARRIFPTWAMGFEITVNPDDEILRLFARAFAVQNDGVADAVTALIKNSGIRIEM